MARWRWRGLGLASCVKTDPPWATPLLTAWHLVLAWAPAENFADRPGFV